MSSDQGATRLPLDELVTTEQRAKEEHRTVGSIQQERHRGEGPPGYRIGKRVLYRRSELEEWRRSRLIDADARA